MSERLVDQEPHNVVLPDTWTTRDGRVVSIAGMDDDHLVNTINLLRRRSRSALVSRAWRLALNALSYAEREPDGAAMAAEEYAEGVMTQAGMDELLCEALPVFLALTQEARRRKLDLTPRGGAAA